MELYFSKNIILFKFNLIRLSLSTCVSYRDSSARLSAIQTRLSPYSNRFSSNKIVNKRWYYYVRATFPVKYTKFFSPPGLQIFSIAESSKQNSPVRTGRNSRRCCELRATRFNVLTLIRFTVYGRRPVNNKKRSYLDTRIVQSNEYLT